MIPITLLSLSVVILGAWCASLARRIYRVEHPVVDPDVRRLLRPVECDLRAQQPLKRRRKLGEQTTIEETK